MKVTYNSAMGYLGKACGNHTEEHHHITFLNLVLKGKLYEAVRFVCDMEKGGVFQPDELDEDRMGMINESAASVLEGKHMSGKNPYCATL